MQSISFDPPWPTLASASSAARSAVAAGAAASPSVTALVPAGADEVSAQAATAFAAEAAQLLAVLNAAHTELVRTGTVLVDVARVYSETDAAAAARLQEIRPQLDYPLAG